MLVECEIAFLQHFFLVTFYFFTFFFFLFFYYFVAVEFGSLYPHSMSCYQTLNTAEIKSTQAHAMTLLVCARLTLIFYAKLLIIGIFSVIYFCYLGFFLSVVLLLKYTGSSSATSLMIVHIKFSLQFNFIHFIIMLNYILTNWGGVVFELQMLPVKTNCLPEQQQNNNILGNYSLLKPNNKQTKEPSTLNINLSSHT